MLESSAYGLIDRSIRSWRNPLIIVRSVPALFYDCGDQNAQGFGRRQYGLLAHRASGRASASPRPITYISHSLDQSSRGSRGREERGELACEAERNFTSLPLVMNASLSDSRSFDSFSSQRGEEARAAKRGDIYSLAYGFILRPAQPGIGRQ